MRAFFLTIAVLSATAAVLTGCTSSETTGSANDDLVRAAGTGSATDVRAALKAGADVDAVGAEDRTALLLATRGNHVDAARVLLEAGADPNRYDAISDTAFLYAGAEGLTDILRLTIEHGADVALTNRYGGTALIPASEHAHVDNVRLLIEAGVEVDHINNLGWTALHEAIVLGTGSPEHVQTVTLLLAAGADPNLPDGEGTSPRTLASQRGYDEIVMLLDEAGARP